MFNSSGKFVSDRQSFETLLNAKKSLKKLISALNSANFRLYQKC